MESGELEPKTVLLLLIAAAAVGADQWADAHGAATVIAFALNAD